MKIDIVKQRDNLEVAVIHSDSVIIKDVSSALDFIMGVKYETGCTNIAINKGAITDDFFVLSTCLAGEILQKFINYGIRFAIYGDFSHYTSKPLKDFIYVHTAVASGHGCGAQRPLCGLTATPI